MVRDLPRENRAPAIVPEDVPGLPGWGGPDTAADGARSLPRFNDCASALRPGEAEAIAALAAELNGNPVLADSYRSPVRPAPSPRLAAILRFVERTAEDLRAVRCADVRALRAAGLGTSEIVALARLVALVAYEAQILSTVWGAGDHR